jgi:hypothetical protein
LIAHFFDVHLPHPNRHVHPTHIELRHNVVGCSLLA